MPRTLCLATTAWTDQRLEEIARRAAEWGYSGIELACWGDHFAIQRALAEADYGQAVLEILEKNELKWHGLNVVPTGQCVGDGPDNALRRSVPDYVWDNGEVTGLAARALAELGAVIQVAQKLGQTTVVTATGSDMTRGQLGWPPPARAWVEAGFRRFAETWGIVFDAAANAGVRLALVVAPGQMAFDLPSAEHLLRAIDGRPEVMFAINPGRLHWQGVDPAELVRAFPDRIGAVHLSDAAVTLTGRNGIFGGYLPGHDHRRGWAPRTAGFGGVDWPTFFRALNDVGYDGPLTVVIEDPGMDRDHAAQEAAAFARRMDFEPARSAGSDAFSSLD